MTMEIKVSKRVLLACLAALAFSSNAIAITFSNVQLDVTAIALTPTGGRARLPVEPAVGGAGVGFGRFVERSMFPPRAPSRGRLAQHVGRRVGGGGNQQRCRHRSLRKLVSS
jgi:hypothetical protein